MNEQGPETEGQKEGEQDPRSIEEPESEDGGQPTAETGSEEEPPEVNGGKRRRLLIFGGIGLVILAIIGVLYWLYARQYESTDDAFIDGDIVQFSPKVAANIAKIYVKSNQYVHKGDPLLDLDPKDLEVKLEQARAQLANATGQKGSAEANVDLTTQTTNASQNQALSNVQTSQTNVRQTQRAADSKQRLIDQARSVARTAQANLARTRTQGPQAESNVHLAQVEYNRRQEVSNHCDIAKQ